MEYSHIGYGICTDDIVLNSIDKLKKLLSHAPELSKKIHDWFEDCEITEPEVDDYLSFFDAADIECGGLAALMRDVIKEAEDINLSAVDDNCCYDYLIYQPRYPWDLPEQEKALTEEKLRQIFVKYIRILTDKDFYIGPMEIQLDFD